RREPGYERCLELPRRYEIRLAGRRIPRQVVRNGHASRRRGSDLGAGLVARALPLQDLRDGATGRDPTRRGAIANPRVTSTRTHGRRREQGFPDRATVARIGLLSNGLLGRQFKRRGTTGEFRTAGATGARYHLELYFVCAELPDLPAGIYHYAADDHSLGRLR